MSIDSASSPVRDPLHKIIPIIYLVGGGIGVISNASQLTSLPSEPLPVAVWLFLLAEASSALYGGWQLWNDRIIGARILLLGILVLHPRRLLFRIQLCVQHWRVFNANNNYKAFPKYSTTVVYLFHRRILIRFKPRRSCCVKR